MGNRSSDHGQRWIIPKSCLFVFEMWPDSTWASRHASAVQAPSGTESPPGSSPGQPLGAGELQAPRLFGGTSPGVCTTMHWGCALHHLGKLQTPRRYSPSTSAHLPKTGEADPCLGLKSHSSTRHQEVDTNSVPSIVSWIPPAVPRTRVTVRLLHIKYLYRCQTPCLEYRNVRCCPHTLT